MTSRGSKLGSPGSRKPAPFSVREAITRADAAFELAPLAPHIERPKLVGQCLHRFAFPLSVCPSTNMTRHGQAWKLSKMKASCAALMSAQLKSRPALPLGGRPQVMAVRFSSVEPDAYADWAKIPVDCLKKLGIIAEDNPRAIKLSQHWEPAAPKVGFVLLECWSGENHQ